MNAPLIRPDAADTLRLWAEPAAGLALAAAGVWIARQGGYVLTPVGGLLLALGVGWTVLALRRLRFRTDKGGPGVVEVDEARITYLGPKMGGDISLSDLAEIRLLTLRRRRVWRLRQTDGKVLLVPLDAMGADQLFDAFSALPGLSSSDLVAALAVPAAPLPGTDPAERTVVAVSSGMSDRLVWQKRGSGLTPV